MNYWIVKTEPGSYSWADFLKEGRTAWTGVRNFQARNNLRAMKKGDPVLFYHSGSERQMVGAAKVAREAHPDPTATEGDWSCVELIPVNTLPKAVPLAAVKVEPGLKDMLLLRNTRLSVSPLTSAQFDRLMKLAGADAKRISK